MQNSNLDPKLDQNEPKTRILPFFRNHDVYKNHIFLSFGAQEYENLDPRPNFMQNAPVRIDCHRYFDKDVKFREFRC